LQCAKIQEGTTDKTIGGANQSGDFDLIAVVRLQAVVLKVTGDQRNAEQAGEY